MPTYIYRDLESGETKEVIQRMDEEHVYFENGIMFERVFTVPHPPVIDSISNINPFSPKEYVHATGKKKGTLGDLFTASAELSEKRTASAGVDHIKESSWKNYEKSRPNSVHPSRAKQLMKENIKKLGADISL